MAALCSLLLTAVMISSFVVAAVVVVVVVIVVEIAVDGLPVATLYFAVVLEIVLIFVGFVCQAMYTYSSTALWLVSILPNYFALYDLRSMNLSLLDHLKPAFN